MPRRKQPRSEPRPVTGSATYRDIDTGEVTNVPEPIQRIQRGYDKVTGVTVNLGGGGMGIAFERALTDPSVGLTAEDLRGAGLEVPADLEARAQGSETLAGWTREAAKSGMPDVADAFRTLERQYAADVAAQYPSPSAESSVLPDMQNAPTTTLPPAPEQAEPSLPEWNLKLLGDWRGGIAHAYLLVGPNDYVSAGLDASDFLAYQLAGEPIKLRVVLRYSVDQGITFLQPSMRDIFDTTLGLGGAPAPGSAGAMLDRTRQLLSGLGQGPIDVAFDNGDGTLTSGEQIKAANKPDLPRGATEAMDLILKFLRTVTACQCGYIASGDKVAEHISDEVRSALLAAGFTDDVINRRVAPVAPPLEQLLKVTERVKTKHAEADVPQAGALIERLDLMIPPGEKAMMQPPRLALLGALHRAGTDIELERKGNPLIMLAPTAQDVHDDVRAASSGIRMIEIPPAGYEDRYAFVGELVGKYPTVRLEMSVAQLAGMTAGLYRRHIEDLFLRAKATAEIEDTEYGLLTYVLLKARKQEIIASEYSGLLEERPLDHGLDAVGGHEAVVEHLRDYVVQVLREGWYDDAPKGILQSGPSGTGKTFTADAIAYELDGWNCFELKPEAIRGKWQGETERLFAKVEQGIVGSVPSVVLIDEAERQFRESGGAGGGNNSAEENLVGGMLRLMGREELRGKVLFIFNCNFPDRLPAAFKRPGRIDIKLAYLPPKTAAERADTFRAVLVAQRRPVPDDASLLRLGEQTDRWTQAEIKNAVVKAGRLMRVKKLEFGEALARSVASLKPATKQIQLMTDLAIAECDDEELLPEGYRGQLADREQLEERIEERLEPRERVRGTRRVGRF